jgi:5-oxopent-3-ene-1,2,5-tricarboxylate decarboxylase / 2-hydroxyhepta-2,4-diene-1,7-dioate isomerase
VEEMRSVATELRATLGDVCNQTVIKRLGAISVGTLIQNLQRLGYHNQFMVGVGPQNRHTHFSGRAMTLRCLPAREDVSRLVGRDVESLHRLAYETIDPGQALVVDARGEMGGAVGGDILASGLAARGGVALVTDGAIRDLPAMQSVDLPIFACGDHPRTFGEVHVAMDLNVPVQCAGVLVMPGDILVGDDEGVVVIPPAVADKLADAGEEQELLDSFILTKVSAGVPLKDAFPPNPDIRAEFETWRRARAIS